jgi:hypothetical protein
VVPAQTDTRHARFALFEAVKRLLVEASAAQPLLLVSLRRRNGGAVSIPSDAKRECAGDVQHGFTSATRAQIVTV